MINIEEMEKVLKLQAKMNDNLIKVIKELCIQIDDLEERVKKIEEK